MNAEAERLAAVVRNWAVAVMAAAAAWLVVDVVIERVAARREAARVEQERGAGRGGGVEVVRGGGRDPWKEVEDRLQEFEEMLPRGVVVDGGER